MVVRYIDIIYGKTERETSLKIRGRSFIYIINKRGPKMLPERHYKLWCLLESNLNLLQQ
jgi:hypothetical protein